MYFTTFFLNIRPFLQRWSTRKMNEFEGKPTCSEVKCEEVLNLFFLEIKTILAGLVFRSEERRVYCPYSW